MIMLVNGVIVLRMNCLIFWLLLIWLIFTYVC